MQFAGTTTGEDGGGALNSTENPMQGKWLYLRRFLKVRANECVKLKLAPNASGASIYDVRTEGGGGLAQKKM